MDTGQPPNGPRLPAGFMAIGSEMIGFTALGVVLDIYVFKTLPWLTMVFTLLGFVVAFVHLIGLARTLGKPPGSSAPREPNRDRQ